MINRLTKDKKGLFVINFVKKHQTIQSIIWIGIIVILWELTSELQLTNKYLLPPFSNVCKEMYRQIVEEKFILQICNSFMMILAGFSVSVLLAVISVILCNYSAIVRSFFRTISVILTPLPGVAIMPIIIMFFGIKETSMIILMIHSVMWPLIINIMGGISSIKKEYCDFASNIELSKVVMVKDIYFFALMPSVISGARIGWGRAWRALISAEMVFGMIGDLGGIGYFIYTNRAFGNMTRVMVGVVSVVIIGIFVESVFFGILEKMTIKKWGL